MEMLKKLASGVYIAYFVVILTTIRALISSAFDVHWTNYFAVGVTLAPLLAFESYKLYLANKTPDPVKINDELLKEIDGIKSKMNLLQLEKSINKPMSRHF